MENTYFLRLKEAAKANVQTNDIERVRIMESAKKWGIDSFDDNKLKSFLNHNKIAAGKEISDLNNSKIFSLDDKKIIELLKNTNNKIYNRKLPFNNIFIDCVFKTKESIFYGFHIIKDDFGTIVKLLFIPNGMPLGMSMRGILPLFDKFDHSLFDKWKTEYVRESEGLLKKNKKEISTFVCNFLDFLNNPDVEIINVERTKEQNIKRIQKGKLPIPPINFVRVTGKLKIYIDKLNSEGCFEYSHSFWVRGHFRTLRNEIRWGDKVGTKIWIPPYIKGKGMLVDKIYDIKK